MRLFILLSILLGVGLLTSCNATRHTYHGFRPTEARDMICVRPLVTMGLVVRGDEVRPDEWFSAHTTHRLQRSLLRQAGALHLQATRPADDSLRREQLRREVEQAAAILARQRGGEGYAQPLPTVESVLAEQPGRYALLLVCRGFMRTHDNYQRQSSEFGHRSAMYGAMGSGRAPQANTLGLYALVYDREQHRVVYFGHRRSHSGQLLNDRVLDRRVQQLLAADFGH